MGFRTRDWHTVRAAIALQEIYVERAHGSINRIDSMNVWVAINIQMWR